VPLTTFETHPPRRSTRPTVLQISIGIANTLWFLFNVSAAAVHFELMSTPPHIRGLAMESQTHSNGVMEDTGPKHSLAMASVKLGKLKRVNDLFFFLQQMER
jgi:hypothetical protein